MDLPKGTSIKLYVCRKCGYWQHETEQYDYDTNIEIIEDRLIVHKDRPSKTLIKHPHKLEKVRFDNIDDYVEELRNLHKTRYYAND